MHGVQRAAKLANHRPVTLDGGACLVRLPTLVERRRAAALQVGELFVGPLVDRYKLFGSGFLVHAHIHRLTSNGTDHQ